MNDVHFSECFDKHCFDELNNIDVHMLRNSFSFYLNKFACDNPVIFDVGTNAGSFIKVLEGFGIRQNVHCFEPHPVISNKTKEVYPFINMNEYCLGNADGNINIYIPKWSVGLSSIINRPVFSKLNQPIYNLDVKCEKLDTYCEINNISKIDFIKIDVEGGEKTIFEGATKMLENKKIMCGVFEIGETLKDANTNETEIIDLLHKYGYAINTTFDNSNYMFYLP